MKRRIHPTTLYLVARNTLVLLFCWGLVEGVLVAQETEEGLLEDDQEYIDFSEGVVDDPGARIETHEVEGREEITVSLDNVSLEDTVRLFAQTTGANIVASAALMEGQYVTVNLTDVHWRPALRSILELHNLDLVERRPDTDIYSVRERAPDAPEPTEVRTFFLDYTTVGEVEASIQSMLGPNAIITPYASRNAIVIRSTEGNLSEIEKLIRELDFPSRQVLIEARILELDDEAVKQLGIRWDSLEAFSIQAGAGPFTWTDSTIRETVRTAEERQWEHDESNRLFDHRGREYSPFSSPQFIPDPGSTRYERFQEPGEPAQYTEVEGSTAYERYQPVTDPSRTIQTGRDREWRGAYESRREKTRDSSAIIEMDSLNIILSALERTEGVSMVSNPKMIVTSGSTNAFFSVGERWPIIETQRERARIEGQADLVTANLATGINTEFIKDGYLETGIDLQVIATVKTDDHIEADIRPSLRRFMEWEERADNRWPIISIKEIGTSFTLRSGQTVAIGGLTETQDGKSTSKIPILGDIPLLGRLFRHEKDVRKQVETIIFVTLSVADPDGLEEEAGVPENARLVHTHRIRERARREEFQRGLRELEEAETLSVEMDLQPDALVEEEDENGEEADVEWIQDRRQPDNDPVVPR